MAFRSQVVVGVASLLALGGCFAEPAETMVGAGSTTTQSSGTTDDSPTSTMTLTETTGMTGAGSGSSSTGPGSSEGTTSSGADTGSSGSTGSSGGFGSSGSSSTGEPTVLPCDDAFGDLETLSLDDSEPQSATVELFQPGEASTNVALRVIQAGASTGNITDAVGNHSPPNYSWTFMVALGESFAEGPAVVEFVENESLEAEAVLASCTVALE